MEYTGPGGPETLHTCSRIPSKASTQCGKPGVGGAEYSHGNSNVSHGPTLPPPPALKPLEVGQNIPGGESKADKPEKGDKSVPPSLLPQTSTIPSNLLLPTLTITPPPAGQGDLPLVVLATGDMYVIQVTTTHIQASSLQYSNSCPLCTILLLPPDTPPTHLTYLTLIPTHTKSSCPGIALQLSGRGVGGNLATETSLLVIAVAIQTATAVASVVAILVVEDPTLMWAGILGIRYLDRTENIVQTGTDLQDHRVVGNMDQDLEIGIEELEGISFAKPAASSTGPRVRN